MRSSILDRRSAIFPAFGISTADSVDRRWPTGRRRELIRLGIPACQGGSATTAQAGMFAKAMSRGNKRYSRVTLYMTQAENLQLRTWHEFDGFDVL